MRMGMESSPRNPNTVQIRVPSVLKQRDAFEPAWCRAAGRVQPGEQS